jgi:hypothetical protein
VKPPKTPRSQCEVCTKTLSIEGGRKQPSPPQQREIDAATGVERGRLLYRYSGGTDPRSLAEAREDGTARVHCTRCSITYDVVDYIVRIYDAFEEGRPLILGKPDRARNTR